MLIKRWRYSILITAATFLIITSPVLACVVSRFPRNADRAVISPAFNHALVYPQTSFRDLIPVTSTSSQFQLPNLSPYSTDTDSIRDSMDEVILADSSLLSTKQKQSSEILQQLNLTPEQQEKIRKIHRRYKRQLSQKRNNLIVLQQQLSDLMVSTKPVDLIRAKNQQLVNLRQEIGKLRFESMLATREILTPQQRQKFREIIESPQSK